MGAIYRRELGSFFNSRHRPGLSDGILSGIGCPVLAVLSELRSNRYE